MATIKSRSSQRRPNDNYRSGWDNIFGKPEADGDVTAYPVMEAPDCAPCAREILRVDGPCEEHTLKVTHVEWKLTPQEEYAIQRLRHLNDGEHCGCSPEVMDAVRGFLHPAVFAAWDEVKFA